MPKLSKEEIIKLYKKPFSMDYGEIWRQGDYFNSIITIKRYIQEATQSGEITEEDLEVFRKRKEIKENKKRETEENLKSLIYHKILEFKTRKEIVIEIKDETGIETNTTTVGKLIEQLIQEGTLKKEEYEKILKKIRENASKKTKLTNHKRRQARKRETEDTKKGLEL